MELPQRKPNRLSNYDYSRNGACFITICTQDRRSVLSDIVGDGFPVPKPCGMIAEAWLRQIPVKYPSVSVDRYVIMPSSGRETRPLHWGTSSVGTSIR